MKLTLWHNPRCSTSRKALKMLEEAGADVTIRKYLDDAPREDEIRAVLAALDVRPIEMMRPKEALFKELGLTRDTDGETLIKAMADHPRLIERPIALRGDAARLGRPPEKVLELV
ncbi:MAG TPA: arsenate reductase (glutaredoxin) [Aliiroseovarius sp.]|nr:arsenate reductase (glutaredoxin) [Aliiroseovarius sp.]